MEKVEIVVVNGCLYARKGDGTMHRIIIEDKSVDVDATHGDVLEVR